jgi:hypothetical protein
MKSPGSHHLPRLGTLAPELSIFWWERLQYLAFELGPKGKVPGPRETLRLGTVFPLQRSRWTAAIPPCFGHIDSPEPPSAGPCEHRGNALQEPELLLTEFVELLRWDSSYANRNSYIIIHCNCKYPECPRYGFNIHFLWISVGETNLVLKVYNGKHLRIGSSDR